MITTTPDTPLQQARAACKQHGIGGMPVVDRGGKVCGAGPPAAGLCYPAACLPSSCHAPAPAPCLAAHAPPRGGLPPQPTPSPSLSPCPHLTLLSSLCPLPFQTPPAASGHHLEERLPPGRRRRAGRHDRRRGGGAPQGRHPRRSGADAAGGSRAGGVSGCVCVCVCVGAGPAALYAACCTAAPLPPASRGPRPPHRRAPPALPALPRRNDLDRLPVVDPAGRCVGIVTRTDMFWTLVRRGGGGGAAASAGMHAAGVGRLSLFVAAARCWALRTPTPTQTAHACTPGPCTLRQCPS